MIEKNINLYFVGIVAIVALVGIVIFIIGWESPTAELQDMQACNVDEDCIYADNTCCPYTDSDNIVPINKAYLEIYKQMGESCSGYITCQENVIDYVEVQCVNKVCTIIPLTNI